MEKEFSEVAAEAQRDALELYDLLLREVLGSDISVTGPDPEANARVEAIFTHMRDGTCPPSQAERMRAAFAARQKS